ncbi:hypothetical protein Xen7305DRAFT_00003150 [Xenococcus sp. PCC 7305]|uniref:hypothetical protein n=1 Tax=Xenococcus sp. PCC 7305 TaxID=102125 RepID=UPI0002AC9827|nr:hypothetical protein [Xenococcus sp. PCC 7305]ELS00614.1 hypothetical protein Xen7305DRAFT_00003150 [Xenococcus sp. PCC 7305]
MTKLKIIKEIFLELLLSIIGLVLFLSHPVKSQGFQNVNEDIDLNIQELNQLRDKFGDLHGQLLLFEKYNSNPSISSYYGAAVEIIAGKPSNPSSGIISDPLFIKLDNLNKKLCQNQEDCNQQPLKSEIDSILNQKEELSAILKAVQKIDNYIDITDLKTYITSELNSNCLTNQLTNNEPLVQKAQSEAEKKEEIKKLQKVFLKKCLLENKDRFKLTQNFDNITAYLINDELPAKPDDNSQFAYLLLTLFSLILLGGFLNWRFTKELKLVKESDQGTKEDFKNLLANHLQIITNNASSTRQQIKDIKDHTQNIPDISNSIAKRFSETNNILEKMNQKLDSTEQQQNPAKKIPNKEVKGTKSSLKDSRDHAESLEAKERALYSETNVSKTDVSPEAHSNITTQANNRDTKEETHLVTLYNKNAKVHIIDVIKVGATQASIEGKRSGIAPPIIFIELETGIYWMVKKPSLDDNCYFLVPKANLIISESQYRTVKSIFKCVNYKNKSSNKFILINPAIVKAISPNKWKLIETGKLKFET